MAIDDTDLLAYVDGELPPERRAEVEAEVASSAELAQRLRAMRASALPYAAAFDAQAIPPVPDELRRRIRELTSRDSRRHAGRYWAWPKLAGAFAAGVLCCAVALRLLAPGTPTVSAAAQVAPWIQAVADYQQLYSRATLTHVSEDPKLSMRIINDLQEADGLRVAVPDLRSAGLSFKRVQRLSFNQQPVVQIVYLPERGEPIALCITRDARADQTPHAQQIGALGTVAWRQGNLGYVLLGRAPTQTLMDLGRRIAASQVGNLYG